MPRAKITEVANAIERYLDANPEIGAVSLAMLHHDVDPKVKKHEWEQALHVLNLRGRVHQKTYSKSGCWCCRSRNYWPVRTKET